MIRWSNARTHAAFSAFSICIRHPEATATEVWLQKWTWLRNCSWEVLRDCTNMIKTEISWIAFNAMYSDNGSPCIRRTKDDWVFFWGWLQTSAIFRKHLPLELCFSLSPIVILRKSKIPSCGESSYEIMSNKNIAFHETQDNLAWKSWRQKNWSVEIQSPLPSYSPELGRLRCKACRPRCPLCLGRSCSCRKHVSASWVFLSFDTESYVILLPIQCFDEPKRSPYHDKTSTSRRVYRNRSASHSEATCWIHATLRPWTTWHSSQPRSRPLRFVFVARFATVRMSETPGIPWEQKISLFFFRSSDFKNGTQIKAGEKETNHNRSQQITTNHNRSQQITTDHNKS